MGRGACQYPSRPARRGVPVRLITAHQSHPSTVLIEAGGERKGVQQVVARSDMDVMKPILRPFISAVVLVTLSLCLSSCSEYDEYDPECVEGALDSYDDYQNAFAYTGEGVDASESDYVYDMCGDTTNPDNE